MTGPETQRRPFNEMASTEAGILIMMLTTASFAASDSIVKLIGTTVPLLVLLWVRYLFQAMVLGVWSVRRGNVGLLLSSMRHSNLKLQFLRAVLLLSNSACSFAGLRYLELPVTTSLAMMAPLIATLLAATVLGDIVSKGKWAMVVTGFIGMLLVVRPGGSAFNWAIVYPIGAATTFACFQVVSSRLSKVGDATTTNLLTALIGTLVLTVLVWADQAETLPQIKSVSAKHWIGVMSMAAVATLAQLLMLQALKRAPLSVLTPFSYLQLGFASLFSWALFRQIPDDWMIAGMAVIALSGIGTVWIHQRGRFS